MSVIGPANLLKTIQKNGTMIQAMILTGKTIVSKSSSGESEISDEEPEYVADAPLAEPVISDEDAAEPDEYKSEEGDAESSPLAEPIDETADDRNEDKPEQTIEQDVEQDKEQEQESETVESDKEDIEESNDEDSEEGSSFLYKRIKHDEE
jgi:type IV secretory pathway VirB10-like protein